MAGAPASIGLTVIYRIVGLASGIGKTTLGEGIVGYLSLKGVKVAAIKHTHQHVIEKSSDAARYKDSGAETVVISGPEGTLIYMEPITDLGALVSLIKYYPIVIAEGFKGVQYGKAIAIAETIEEVERLEKEEPNLWLIVSHDFDLVEEARKRGLNAMLFEETKAIAEIIYKDAVETIASLLPEEACALCGIPSCVELAEKILTGEKDPLECPLATRISVEADSKALRLDPKVENMLIHVIKGALLVTEGAPESPREIRITIRLK